VDLDTAADCSKQVITFEVLFNPKLFGDETVICRERCRIVSTHPKDIAVGVLATGICVFQGKLSFTVVKLVGVSDTTNM
jgi:hypothetical protein